jgi:hypothetical protein
LLLQHSKFIYGVNTKSTEEQRWMVTLTCLLGFGSWAKQVKIFLEKGNGPTPLQVSGAGEMFHSYIPH